MLKLYHKFVSRPSVGGLSFPEYVIYRGEQVLYCFLSKVGFLTFLSCTSSLTKYIGHPSYLTCVAGISRVLDHLLDPEARGFGWGRNCHCALKLALEHFPSNAVFSSGWHRHCDSWLWYWREVSPLWVWGLTAFAPALIRRFSLQWLFSLLSVSLQCRI